MGEPTWDILINSLQHRSGKLRELLTVLEPQILPSVTVRALVSPDASFPFIECTNRLIKTSGADYICFIDDDDFVAPHYVEAITDALRERPDYVGFRVRYTEDGVPQAPVIHSLRARSEWLNTEEFITRDITHFNPIRRDLVPLWPIPEFPYHADREWARLVRESGKVQREVFVDDELHYYRHCTTDTAADRVTLAGDGEDISGEFPWVEWVSARANNRDHRTGRLLSS